MSGIDQAARAVRIHTGLPDNTLALSRMTGHEQLSELFEYTLECVSENAALDLYEVLGQPISVEFDTDGDGVRHLHGLVCEAGHIGSRGDYALYKLTMTAWPWLMTRTTDCRIFADQNVPAIIEAVLSDIGFDDFDNRLMGQYEPRNFCVQYRESDFAFISRLMEHEGIYYFFEHFDNRHVLVICDDSSAHAAAPNYSDIPHFPESTDSSRITDHLVDWQFRRRIRSGKYVTKDFAFDEPKRDLLVQTSGAAAGNYPAQEIYDYPGGFPYTASGEMTRSYGVRLAEARMEALSADHEVASANGNVRGLGAGNVFSLSRCERDDQNREYLVLYASLVIQMDSYFSGDGGGAVELTSSFRCMPSSVPFRPRRKTPKPEIRGPQTAIVVGAAGEEIWTDQHGRVKLQFHWDRYGQSNETSSCWVRVSQAWAGEKWGSIHVPRMGQEVIVEYIDGDPDRPIVTGRVYNGDRPVPYDLPENATQSGIKSRSSTGGKPANFNEIRMEDKKGSEELYLHAEKDQTNIVENDESTQVGHDRKEEVGNDEDISVGKNRTEKVGANETISIAGNRKESVGKNETITIADNRKETVGKDETISIGKNKSETVGHDVELKIGKNRSETVGDDAELSVGKKIIIEAGDEIVLSTGKASITMKKDGTVVISGKNITLKGSGVITGKASKNIVLQGAKILQN